MFFELLWLFYAVDAIPTDPKAEKSSRAPEHNTKDTG